MIDLTARQIQILRAIIEEFTDTAQPVGSETLDKKFNIGVSPATIRNEMVTLTKQGYLQKSHSSAGRIPTSKALKLYVNELMRERELTVADEVSAKERIWKSRKKRNELLRQITKVLAEKSHALAVTLGEEGDLYSAGYANLLQMPEFYDLQRMRHVLQLIEETAMLEEIFERGNAENKVQVVYGSELGNRHFEPVGMIHSTIYIDGRPSRIAVLGSNRFDYPYMIPLMRYMSELIEEIVE